MTTPTQHLEIFDEKFGKDSNVVKFLTAKYGAHIHHEPYSNAIKQHLIQTVISVLEEQLNHEVKLLRIVECEEGCPFCDRGLQRKCNAYESDREWNEAKQNTIDSLTTTLSTWKALL